MAVTPRQALDWHHFSYETNPFPSLVIILEVAVIYLHPHISFYAYYHLRHATLAHAVDSLPDSC